MDESSGAAGENPDPVGEDEQEAGASPLSLQGVGSTAAAPRPRGFSR